MNPFTAHPHRQGVTYFEHWRFAMGIAGRLLMSVVAFGAHAALPSIPIRPHLDLEATAGYLTERNRWIETAKDTTHGEASSELAFLGGPIALQNMSGLAIKGGAPMS